MKVFTWSESSLSLGWGAIGLFLMILGLIAAWHTDWNR